MSAPRARRSVAVTSTIGPRLHGLVGRRLRVAGDGVVPATLGIGHVGRVGQQLELVGQRANRAIERAEHVGHRRHLGLLSRRPVAEPVLREAVDDDLGHDLLVERREVLTVRGHVLLLGQRHRLADRARTVEVAGEAQHQVLGGPDDGVVAVAEPGVAGEHAAGPGERLRPVRRADPAHGEVADRQAAVAAHREQQRPLDRRAGGRRRARRRSCTSAAWCSSFGSGRLRRQRPEVVEVGVHRRHVGRRHRRRTGSARRRASLGVPLVADQRRGGQAVGGERAGDRARRRPAGSRIRSRAPSTGRAHRRTCGSCRGRRTISGGVSTRRPRATSGTKSSRVPTVTARRRRTGSSLSR